MDELCQPPKSKTKKKKKTHTAAGINTASHEDGCCLFLSSMVA